MTSTSTYAFNPSASDVVLNAYANIQIRRTELATQHLSDAAFQANLLMVDISNRSPNRFCLETQTQVLTPGLATYSLTNRTLAIALASISTTSGGVTTDRVIGPLSTTEYASIPVKSQQARPTSYMFSLLSTPTISLWPTPDSATTYTLTLTTFRQLQDVDMTSGTTLDSPYRFLDSITTGLAARLALMYRPDAFDRLNALYEARFKLAAMTDQEDVNLYVTPGLSSYFTR
jgi:hypothetical protein